MTTSVSAHQQGAKETENDGGKESERNTFIVF